MLELHSKIKKQQELNLPFVVYRKPDTSQIKCLFQFNSNLYQSHEYLDEGFVFTSFDKKQNYIIPKSVSESCCFLVKKSNESPFLQETNNLTNLNKDQYQYENLIKKALALIKKGIFEKVVLSREEIVTIKNFDLSIIFDRLLQTYPDAFVYCFFHPKVGLWLGATPERLIKLSGNSFETIALAGTQKALNNEKNIIWSKKEKEEQQVVTDYIVSQLNNKTYSLRISEPFTTKSGNLYHIKTEISGTLKKEYKLSQIIDLLHPTPAVCGFPTSEAKDFIMKNESYNRSFYTGFLGELNLDSSTDLFVNLRCMQVKNQQFHLYVGCGITRYSVPENEWQESLNKSMIMKCVL